MCDQQAVNSLVRAYVSKQVPGLQHPFQSTQVANHKRVQIHSDVKKSYDELCSQWMKTTKGRRRQAR
jgi:hypothetical protein